MRAHITPGELMDRSVLWKERLQAMERVGVSALGCLGTPYGKRTEDGSARV